MPSRKENGNTSAHGHGRKSGVSPIVKSPSKFPKPEDTDGAITIYDYNSTEEEEEEEAESADSDSDSDGGGGHDASGSGDENGNTQSDMRSKLRPRTTRSSGRKDKSYSYMNDGTFQDESTDDSDEEDDDGQEEMHTEYDEQIQPMIQALTMTDFYDMRENQHLISRTELDHLYHVNLGLECDEMNEESIKFETERLSKAEFDNLMKKAGKPVFKRSTRRKSGPPKRLINEDFIVQNGKSKSEESGIITTVEETGKTSYEDRLLAKNRVSYKTKTYQHPKSVGRKLAKLQKKVILSKVEKEVESRRPLSVRKELKRIFMERGFPEWKYDPNQAELTKAALEKTKKEFSEWLLLLRAGFNIIMYGYGSKVPVFEELEKHLDDEFTIMEIDGTVPKVDPVEALSQFVSDCLIIKHSLKGSSYYAKVRNLLPKLRPLHLHPPVFLFVRNLEQIYAKNDQLFFLTAHLATLPFVHMVASCDHFNSPLIFDQGLIADMALVWKRCTTYAPYKVEAKLVTGAFTADAFHESSSRVTLGHVYGAVTVKSKRAFNILASLQLQAVKSKQYDINTWNGIEFNELARHCREKFIANNDAQLNTLLLEFIDNKIVVKSKNEGTATGGGRRGVKKNVENCLRIAIDDAKLEEFIIANPVQND